MQPALPAPWGYRPCERHVPSARDAGLSREGLYKALSENGNPSFATVLKVARALAVRLHAEAA